MTWGLSNPSAVELYRQQTASSVPITLRRKRCTCGKVLTAKQLQQYGVCESCVRTRAANPIKEAA
jgi:hypothetical protein